MWFFDECSTDEVLAVKSSWGADTLLQHYFSRSLFKQQSPLLTWSHWVVSLSFSCQLGIAAWICCCIIHIYLSIFVRSIRAATPCKNVALMRVGSAASAVENHFLAPPPHNSLRFHTTESRGSNVKCKQAAPTCELPSEFFLHSDQPHETYHFLSSRKKTQPGRMRATFFGRRWGKQAWEALHHLAGCTWLNPEK